MILRKWDYETHEYQHYKIPNDWKVTTYSTMDDIIHCAQCGKRIKFGDGFSSLEIHTWLGLGYTVCPDCHKAEMDRRDANA